MLSKIITVAELEEAIYTQAPQLWPVTDQELEMWMNLLNRPWPEPDPVSRTNVPVLRYIRSLRAELRTMLQAIETARPPAPKHADWLRGGIEFLNQLEAACTAYPTAPPPRWHVRALEFATAIRNRWLYTAFRDAGPLEEPPPEPVAKEGHPPLRPKIPAEEEAKREKQRQQEVMDQLKRGGAIVKIVTWAMVALGELHPKRDHTSVVRRVLLDHFRRVDKNHPTRRVVRNAIRVRGPGPSETGVLDGPDKE